MTNWHLQIPDETDQTVRDYLAHHGGNETELSEFVDRAVRQMIFWNTVQEIRERNKDLSAEEADALANEAVAWVRAKPS